MIYILYIHTYTLYIYIYTLRIHVAERLLGTQTPLVGQSAALCGSARQKPFGSTFHTVKTAYRGQRLIEPSSSRFPPKFPSG